MLMIHSVRRLSSVGVMVVLLLGGMVRMMILMLKFRHLHGESLMGLPTIHHGMLPLVSLAVHCIWV